MNTRIPSLNGLRALSILMVIASHLNQNKYFPHSFNKFASVFFNGSFAVDIFFIISGFLITSLLINEKRENGHISLKNFYIRRVLRIFPAYYFFLLILFVFQMFGYGHSSFGIWLGNITFTRQFFPEGNPELGHLWSLSVEECFYLIWPVLFIKVNQYKVHGIIIAIILAAIGRFFCYSYPTIKFSHNIFSAADALLIGCLFAIKYEEIVIYVTKARKKILIAISALIFSLPIYAYFFQVLTLGGLSPVKAFWIIRVFAPLSYSLFGSIGLFTNILIALIIVYAINIKGVLFTFLNFSFMDYIGRLSYSIYLWQQPFTYDFFFGHRIPIYILILLIFLCAAFSYHIIERPFLRLKLLFASS
jgi:peptidoglycan/LPS O-acetylase OafA/YrhL